MDNWLSGGAGGQPSWMNSPAFNKTAGIGGILQGLMGIFGGHGKNPAFEANKTIDQIPGQTKGYYDPYMNAGNTALNERMKRYGQDPNQIYNQLGE